MHIYIYTLAKQIHPLLPGAMVDFLDCQCSILLKESFFSPQENRESFCSDMTKCKGGGGGRSTESQGKA